MGNQGRGEAESEPQEKENWFQLKDREVASQTIDLRIGPSPLAGSFAELAAEQGQMLPLEIQLQSRGALPPRLTCRLEGLPNRVVAEPVEIDSTASTVNFQLNVSNDAPLGTFAGVECRMSGELDSTPVSFVVSAFEPLMITEPGQLHRAADGRILSPLEALRDQNAK